MGTLNTEALPITALLATIRGWPVMRPALEHLVGQTLAAGGEVIVADGSGESPPSDDDMAEVGGPIVWLSMPDASVFQLRLAAYRAARGDVIAVTEDHCFVAPDWIERILAAHASYPEAGVVGGAVLNGTDRKVVDWAAFFLTQGPLMPPLETGFAARVSGPANCSYKRRVLERLGGDDEQGVIDFLELPVALEDEKLVTDDSIRVLHHQSQGFGARRWPSSTTGARSPAIAAVRPLELTTCAFSGRPSYPCIEPGGRCASSAARSGPRGQGSRPHLPTCGSSTARWPASYSATRRVRAAARGASSERGATAPVHRHRHR